MTVDAIVCFNSRRFKLCGEGGGATGFAVIPYIQGITEPSGQF